MKMKFDFTANDYEKLHNSALRQEIIEELHASLDAAIASIDDNVKCTVTIDTDKE